MTLEVFAFACRSDNFGALLHDSATGLTASIDAPDADAIEAALTQTGWPLDLILATHHHHDHVAGNLALKARHGCRIFGPALEQDRIPGLTAAVQDGDIIPFAGHRIEVIHTPGHTLGHVCFHLLREGMLFSGDTLFAMGCGRVLEGTNAQMHASLVRLAELDKATQVWFGHDYTQANGQFCQKMEPGNMALRRRMIELDQMTAPGRQSIPTTMAQELATNVFLRWDSAEIRENLGLGDASDEAVFSALRTLKNQS